MMHELTHWLLHYGYALIVVLVILENIGLPLPAETSLITAAAFAARGKFSLWAVIAAGTFGGVIGGAAGYGLGVWVGLRLLRKFGRYIHLSEARLMRAHGFFERRGASAAFWGRFTAVLRIVIPMTAGVARMPFGKFMSYNATGALAASIFYALLGYEFGSNLPALRNHILEATVVVGAIVVAVFGWRLFRRRRTIRAS
ncbi:MAG: DedA family protein [Gemmatimonadota bacterium]|nr:DedA family protein [Gemmatimonadota bacterium]